MKALGYIISLAFAVVAGTSSLQAASADTLALIKGVELFQERQYDLARERLMESAKSENINIRAESYLYLNALEAELGDWDAARPWLERYHAEAMNILKLATEFEEEMRRHKEETERSIVRIRRLVAVVVCVMVAMALLVAVIFMGRHRWRARAHTSVEAGGNEKLHTGAFRELADIFEWRRHLAGVEVFMQTPVYTEIAELERQRADRRAQVLSNVRQQALDAVLAGAFSEFMAELRAAYPSLTPGDVKLCCLSLVPLSSFGRAICFGSTETNIIKQRKHKIKRKLASDDAGRELFEFIFAARGA